MGFTLGIEVTRKCMFRCNHCFVDAGRPRAQEAGTREFRELLKEAALCGVNDIGWSGGEPLLRKDLEDLTAEAASYGMRVGLATNGYLATHERLASLKRAGLRVIQVSLDGADHARAKRYRVGPKQAFARALRAVEESAALGLTTYVCTLLSPDTAGEIAEMVELAMGLGATGLRYTMYMPVGRARGETKDDRLWAHPEILDFLRVVRRHSGSRFRVLVDCPTGPMPGMRRYVCSAGRKTGYVTADGLLYPCTALIFEDYCVGNVFERPLGVLLNQGRMFKVLRQMANSRPRGECARCDLAVACRGGCPGRIMAVHGRIGGRGYRLSMPGCLIRLHRSGQRRDANAEGQPVAAQAQK